MPPAKNDTSHHDERIANRTFASVYPYYRSKLRRIEEHFTYTSGCPPEMVLHDIQASTALTSLVWKQVQ